MMESFGSRLKQLRNSKHLRQDQVAELIGVNKAAVSYYESDTRQPPFETLIRLASIYNVSTDYLLGVNSSYYVDLTGLTPADVQIVEATVRQLADKNKIIQRYENNLDYCRKGRR